MPLRLCFLLTLLLAPTACAQEPSGDARADAAPARTEDALTETEQRVQALLAEDGVHVVHFWAPWCHNSMSELRANVWPEVIAAHDDVTFIFVTVFNDGALDEGTLRRFGVPDRVHMLAQPDFGLSTVKANRRQTFLGRPLTWTPTTWIFHRNGTLAFAVNYGEVRGAMMQTLLENVRTDWSRH